MDDTVFTSDTEAMNKSQFVPVEPRLTYNLRPFVGFSNAGQQDAHFTRKAFMESIFETHEAYMTRQDYEDGKKKALEAMSASGYSQDKVERPFPRLVFLGTASSVPSKYRNVSSQLLYLEENKSLLVDCGEGTLNQLVTLYGYEEAQRVLCTLRCICITHMHADHFGGIWTVIKQRFEAFKSLGLEPGKLLLLVPSGAVRWLNFMREHGFFTREIMSNLLVVYTHNIVTPSTQGGRIMGENFPLLFRDFVRGELGLEDLVPVPVLHSTKQAYGFCVQAQGWKVVFSGDTVVPCDELVAAGRHCDVLVHECTYADGFEAHAAANRHCTLSQAAAQGERMHARCTLMTHFSTRQSAAFPPTDKVDAQLLPRVGFASDLMTFTLDDIPFLQFLPDIYRLSVPKDVQLTKQMVEKMQQRGGKKSNHGHSGRQQSKKRRQGEAS